MRSRRVCRFETNRVIQDYTAAAGFDESDTRVPQGRLMEFLIATDAGKNTNIEG